MAHTSEIDEISPDKVNQVVQDFKDAGATNVTQTEQANNTFSVIATFADSQPGSAGQEASTAPIGQTINGMLITHYGYPGDSSPDNESMQGIGDRGNKLVANLSVALTHSARQALFDSGSNSSTGQQFAVAGVTFQDDDTAPEENQRIDVYDPYYTGIDQFCTPEMYAKSKALMIAAGILVA
jgi:hypothetical protein